MEIDVVPLPRMLTDEHVRDRVVVVFDVLRATTTIAAALAAGAKEIRVFDSLDAARSAAADYTGEKLLCGETNCLRPEGFDLGNSPSAYTPDVVGGKTLFLSTTNGTRALVAARKAALLLTGALVNAASIGEAIAVLPQDVTLLCAGTDGSEAVEDCIGAGAVIAEVSRRSEPQLTAAAEHALQWFTTTRDALVMHLRATTGGKNVLAADLPQDIAFAARLNSLSVVPRCDGYTMTIRPMQA